MKFFILDEVTVPLGPNTVFAPHDDGIAVWVGGHRWVSEMYDYTALIEALGEMDVL